MIYLDTTQVFLQARTQKNKKREVKFELSEIPIWQVSPYWDLKDPLYKDSFFEEKEMYVESGRQRIAQENTLDGIAQYDLETVQIVAREPEEEEDLNRRNKLYGTADFTLEGEQVPPNLSVSQALQGRVPGVQVFQGLGGSRISIRGSRNQPLVLLDGMPTDVSFIDGIPMMDIDHIDVVKGPRAAIYGGRGSGGLVAVYTNVEKGEKKYLMKMQRELSVLNCKDFQFHEFFILPIRSRESFPQYTRSP